MIRATVSRQIVYLLENPGNRIRVYLVYGMDNVEISYTSSSTNHQWYRYKQKALDREPVPCEQNGETSVVRNIEEDAGYYVEDPASGLNGWYVWIIDYSKYTFNVESITVKGNCDGFWLEGSPTVPVMYYYTPTGNRITVKREFNVAYQTLEWSEDNGAAALGGDTVSFSGGCMFRLLFYAANIYINEYSLYCKVVIFSKYFCHLF